MLQTASMLGDLGGGEVGRPIQSAPGSPSRPDKPTPHITGHIKSQDDTNPENAERSVSREKPKPMRKDSSLTKERA